MLLVRSTVSALALTCLATAAQAALTPAALWDQLRASAAAAGLTMTEGARTETAGALVLTDIAVTSLDADPKDPVAALTIPRLTLTPTADGAVRTVIDGPVSGTVDTPADPDTKSPAATTALTLDAPGNSVLSTETAAGGVSHAFDYPALTATADTRAGDGGRAPLTLRLTDLTGTQTVTPAAGATVTATEARAAEMRLEAAVTPPADPEAPADAPRETVTTRYTAGDLTLAGSLRQPDGVPDWSGDVSAALRAGLAVEGTLAAARSATVMASRPAGTESGTPPDWEAVGAATGGSAGVSMNAAGLRLSAIGGAQEWALTGAELPAGLGGTLAGAEIALTLPLLAGPGQPVAATLALRDLVLADPVWVLLDPGAALARGPLALTLDLAGTAAVPADLTGKSAGGGADPLTMERLALKSLAASAFGAATTWTGDVTWPPGADVTAPVGTLSGRASGIDPLIQALASLGLVPEEQVMGARMMLMMFAKPDPADPTTLTTEVQFLEGGSVVVNGQRLK